MKRALFSIVSAVLLTACGASQASITYQLKINTTDATQRQELADSSMRVIERRLDRMGEAIDGKKAQTNATGATITLHVEDQEALTQLTTELQSRFWLDLMGQTQPGEQVDLHIEDFGDFTKSGITHDDIAWVESTIVPGQSVGAVHIMFTPAGQAKLSAYFTKMLGKNVGIFVRDQLVSQMQVQSEGKATEDIVIPNVPTPELAQVFADDVNVGIHVTFTPVP